MALAPVEMQTNQNIASVFVTRILIGAWKDVSTLAIIFLGTKELK